MSVVPVFPAASPRAGMYESFYLRAVSPDEPLGVWIRYTVHKRPGEAARGSLWCTVFDAHRGRPFQHKLTSEELSVPAAGWISVGEATLGPAEAQGACGDARWSLRFASTEPELRHLPRAWMYRAPLPRTKLTSPAPAATFEGTVELPGRTLDLQGWRGMVGHNWGAEHAERWIWLHGIDFAEDPNAWLDVAIGRIRVGPWLTPWVANGALSLAGRRIPLGGLGARGLLVAETPRRARLCIPGPQGLTLDAHIDTPEEANAGWAYADPDGSQHDVSNCSIAALTLTVREPGIAPARTLTTAHGAAYELGMREHDHGVPIAPFTDG
ncbi:MAG TPA: hypothetical protein VID70_03075 [Solirubrobacteraceae bacterium]